MSQNTSFSEQLETFLNFFLLYSVMPECPHIHHCKDGYFSETSESFEIKKNFFESIASFIAHKTLWDNQMHTKNLV